MLPVAVKFVPETPVESNSSSYGIMAQEVMTFNKYIKAILGLRYSYISSQDGTSAGPTTGDAWNPMLGIMLTPVKTYDPNREIPILFEAGDYIHFVPVTEKNFLEIKEQVNQGTYECVIRQKGV